MGSPTEARYPTLCHLAHFVPPVRGVVVVYDALEVDEELRISKIDCGQTSSDDLILLTL
jgi:hypothetical protein